MTTVYDQLIGAGAPAIKPPFAYNIEADTDRYLRVQITMTQGRQVRLMSQRVVNLGGIHTTDALKVLADAAAACWDEIQATAGLDAIISAVIGTHSLDGSTPAAPFPTFAPSGARHAADDGLDTSTVISGGNGGYMATEGTTVYSVPIQIQAADDPH